MGEDRKPTLTDEEESGSSTSSCDEMGPVGDCPAGDSDTASAPSPTNITSMYFIFQLLTLCCIVLLGRTLVVITFI